MKFLKDNISWIAPTAAILLVAGGFLDRDGGLRLFSGGDEQAAAAPQVAPEAQPRVERLNTLVEAAMAPEAPVEAGDVTRNAPVDLLQVAPAAAPEPAPLPAAVVAPPAPVDTAAAVDFFNSARSQLAVDNACGDDLRTLAAQARIYFPAGQLSGEDAGFNAARLIGKLAKDCPGFQVQVEGHSDPSGDPGQNLRLSKKRAEAVITRLEAAGIDTSNFVAVGYGDTRPSNVRGPEGSAYYDRRVEFSVVEAATRASFSAQPQPWAEPLSACAEQLDRKANQLRQFYSPGSITVPLDDLDPVFSLASEVMRCDGVRLRLVGQHTDEPGTRENARTGRMRALAMMSSLVAAGYPSEQILVGAPSYSVDVPGQPGLPNSRIDFQVIPD